MTAYTVPLFTRSGDQAGMTFGGGQFEASPDARRRCICIAVYGHGKARVEILQWCAARKTNSAIADILLVSETTMETHVVRACRELDCITATHAVAEAIRARLIY
jgi:DNA-binding CsgD family transcriptional regulator